MPATLNDLRTTATAYEQAQADFEFWHANADHVLGSSDQRKAAESKRDRCLAALVWCALEYVKRPEKSRLDRTNVLPYNAAAAAGQIFERWTIQNENIKPAEDGAFTLLMFAIAQELENAHYWGSMGAPLDREGEKVTRGFAMLADLVEADPSLDLETIDAALNPSNPNPRPFPPPKDDDDAQRPPDVYTPARPGQQPPKPQQPRPTEKILSALEVDHAAPDEIDTPPID